MIEMFYVYHWWTIYTIYSIVLILIEDFASEEKCSEQIKWHSELKKHGLPERYLICHTFPYYVYCTSYIDET